LKVLRLRLRLGGAEEHDAGAQGKRHQGARPACNGRLTTNALSLFPMRLHDDGK
jgi:hypothetical protein